jgi:hypothetical protein
MESSQPLKAVVVDSNHLSLLDTGRVLVFLQIPNTAISDTLELRIIGPGGIIPKDTVKTLVPEALTLFADSINLALGIESFPLTWTLTPRKFTGVVACRSLQPTIVAMKDAVSITPISSGSARIVCALEGFAIEDTLRVKVPVGKPTVQLDSLRLAQKAIQMKVGDPGLQLTYQLHPALPEIPITWSASSNIATVSPMGFVTAVAAGTVSIKAVAVGATVVSDSLLLTIADSVPAARWKMDTLIIPSGAGAAVSVNLPDHVLNPSQAQVAFSYTGSDTRISLNGSKLQLAAKATDTGWIEATVNLIQESSQSPVTVRFVLSNKQFALKLTAVNGSIAAQPGKPTYRFGDTVSLLATPAQGFAFSQWAGDASGSLPSTNLVMNGDKQVTATFVPIIAGGCIGATAGDALNAALQKAYAQPKRPITLCPSPGLYESNTIEVFGKVQIEISP